MRVQHSSGGASTASPHFPHERTAFGSFSDYGLDRDYVCPDLDAWWTHHQAIAKRSRMTKASQLFQALESAWPGYEGKMTTRAAGYSANQRTDLGETVCRWLWDLRHWDWIEVIGGKGRAPEDTYALTPETAPVVDSEHDSVCPWPVAHPEFARALGMKTTVPPKRIVQYLQRRKQESGPMPRETAHAYYEHVAHSAPEPDSEADRAIAEGLIYAPGPTRNWWRADECLGSESSALSTLCGMVGQYDRASPLWSRLRVATEPDLGFLTDLWARAQKQLDPSNGLTAAKLRGSYVRAEELLGLGAHVDREVPLVAENQWRMSSACFVADAEELVNALTEAGMHRWSEQHPEAFSRFAAWAGILRVHSNGRWRLAKGSNARPDQNIELAIKNGVALFGHELKSVMPEIWARIQARVRDLLRCSVKVVSPLRFNVVLVPRSRAEIKFQSSFDAVWMDPILYLSALCEPGDLGVASAMLDDLSVSSSDRWSLINALSTAITRAARKGATADPLSFDEEQDAEVPPFEAENSGQQQAAKPDAEVGKKTRRRERQPGAAKPEPIPIEDYRVTSDSGEQESAAGTGGMVVPPRRTLRNPGRGKGKGERKTSDSRKPSASSTEQRAVDLVKTYALDPEGIEVIDTRLVPGVGADLFCSDAVFREIKARSGTAGDQVNLTWHEHERAHTHAKAYELVIVEYVWSEPVITLVRNPLHRLKYFPAGDVVVEGWQTVRPAPRVIKLGPQKPASKRKTRKSPLRTSKRAARA